MNFNIGDLIVSKDNKNKKQVGYIIKMHKADEDEEWLCESITIKWSEIDWTRLPVYFVEDKLTETKRTRWYHFGVANT